MKLLEELPPPTGYATGPLRFDESGIPTFEECRDLIRLHAYRLWELRGGGAEQNWLDAEWQLFLKMEDGGYRIYICYPSLGVVQDVYKVWKVALVKPDGLHIFERK